MLRKIKRCLVDITILAEQVACWVLSFSLCLHVAHAFEKIFNPDVDENASSTLTKIIVKHKKEGSKTRSLDTDDRNSIMVEFQKHAHPFN